MTTKQLLFSDNIWSVVRAGASVDEPQYQLVLAFGSVKQISDPAIYNYLSTEFPGSHIVMASTAGEILGDNVYDDTVAVTALAMEHTTIKAEAVSLTEVGNSYDAGKQLMSRLQSSELAYVLVISDGAAVNGSELVAGLNENNPQGVPVTGGLAGDAARFQHTFVGLNATATEQQIVAIGFYGDRLKVGHGSFGGWNEFGQERTVTRAEKNVLYEIDGKNALDLYKEYLGAYANELPGSALLFPLSLKVPGGNGTLVRTILSVNDTSKTMTFAGNLPEGSKVRLMKANFDSLVEGSAEAANYALPGLKGGTPQFALLISCVGRKLILQNRTDEEVLAVRELFADDLAVSGFYSYGEISPFNPSVNCELHNQTMTITTFSEQ